MMVKMSNYEKRPTTIGIRAFLPYDDYTKNENYHFELPNIKPEPMISPDSECILCFHKNEDQPTDWYISTIGFRISNRLQND